MDTQEAVDFLFTLLVQHQHPTVKLETLEVLHRMKSKFPRLSIGVKRIMPLLMEEADLYKDTLAISYAAQQHLERHESDAVKQARNELIQMMERKLDNTLKRIFWLIGLSYPPGTIQPLYANLRHQDENMRISAVEFLDNILDPTIKKVVITIVESATLQKLSPEDFDRLELSLPTEFDCYQSILNGKDDQLKIAVLQLIETLYDPELDPLIQQAAQDEHARVRAVAERILEKKGPSAA
jgi:AAA family ATP:ADP antiporter